jgi:hypothetical protein
MKALRSFLGFVTLNVLGAVIAPGCTSGTFVYSDCPLDGKGHLAVPVECCPCATPEGCDILYYSKGLTPPPVPEWCCEKWPDDLPACKGSGNGAIQACPWQCTPQAPEGWTGRRRTWTCRTSPRSRRGHIQRHSHIVTLPLDLLTTRTPPSCEHTIATTPSCLAQRRKAERWRVPNCCVDADSPELPSITLGTSWSKRISAPNPTRRKWSVSRMPPSTFANRAI